MGTLWYCLVAIMIAGYVILDGFDLGAGILHFSIGRTESQRRRVIRAIGPVWDGNEVWLLAGGGTLYFAFPGLYASSYSGFYLPLMIVLWLLMIRGVAIEFRNHLEGDLWRPFFDVLFMLASGLLAIFFGAALGNVIRGVPLDAYGVFFLPLWTDFRTGKDAGILDWYTILVGLLAFFTLAAHGGLWIALKNEDLLQHRARTVAKWAWSAIAVLTVAVTLATFQVQPLVLHNLTVHVWGFVFPDLALAGLIAMLVFILRGDDLKAFLSSCAFIAGMLTSAVFGIYPYVLPSNSDPRLGLTIANTQTADYGLSVALAWWIPGMLLVAGYSVFIYRHFAGKVRLEEEGY
jgi:cytochrome bd ubiquinol oxidase subunit II